MTKFKFIKYVKYENNCNFMKIDTKKQIRISVDIYEFDTGINIQDYNNYDINDMIECTKLEFDKAYNLALALLTNRAINK